MSHTEPVRRWLAGAFAVLATVSYGCAGDGDEPGAAGSSTSTTAAATGEDRASADRRLAESIVLRESDLPRDVEWTSTPSEEDPEGEAQLRGCLGLPPESLGVGADSPTFSAGDVTRVDSSATLTPGVETVDRDMAILGGPRLVDCLRAQFETQLQDEPAHVGPVAAERIEFPALGDASFAVRMSTVVETEDGEQVPLFVDFIVVFKERAGMTLTLMNAPEPFPTDLAVALAETMVARA